MQNKILCLFILILLSCTPSPRYTSDNIIYGVASHYGHNDGFDGELTANGEIFDQHKLSAAHKSLPLNTWIKVTNLDRLTKPSIELKRLSSNQSSRPNPRANFGHSFKAFTMANIISLASRVL